jgi:DNA-binding NarL/FixJ family response regulator
VLVDPGGEHWERAKASGSPVIVLSSQFEDPEPLLRAVESGALGVFSIDCEGINLMAALRRVAGGGVALSRAQTRTLCDALRERPPEPPPEPVRLSKRELQILQSIDAGELIKQTARSLGISPRTVENTQRLMFRKLGVRNRAQAIARAYSLGLIDLPTEHDQ